METSDEKLEELQQLFDARGTQSGSEQPEAPGAVRQAHREVGARDIRLQPHLLRPVESGQEGPLTRLLPRPLCSIGQFETSPNLWLRVVDVKVHQVSRSLGPQSTLAQAGLGGQNLATSTGKARHRSCSREIPKLWRRKPLCCVHGSRLNSMAWKGALPDP